ncbi:hypothetical protein RA29_16585 [Tateyamaria sp. ANG-S1]|nr:hypothetical protein RA29_16585 [Tateyamaria sp. ANG-S1]
MRLSSPAAQHIQGGPQNGKQKKTAPTPPEFMPVDTSGVGEFPWQWNNMGTFNAQTWAFLNTFAARAPSGMLRLIPGLTTWYYNLISATAYVWTKDDRARIDTHLKDARAAQSQLIQAYQSMVSPISPADKQTAATALGLNAASTLIYVVDYQIAYIWSGRKDSGLAPLTVSEIRATPMDSLFTGAPAAVRKVLKPLLEAAFQNEEAWAAEIDSLWNMGRAIRHAADNTFAPGVANDSGMYTIDRSGVTDVRHSFTVAPSTVEIENTLSSSKTITQSLSMRDAGSGSALVSVDGAQAARVPQSVVKLRAHKGAPKDVLAHDGAGDRAEVRITYHGPAEITVSAQAFAPTHGTGWYLEAPITQAARNQSGTTKTGYQFQLPVDTAQLQAAEMSLLQRLLVCRAITFEVVYPNGDPTRLAKSIPTGPGSSATLMGDVHVSANSKHAAKAAMQTDTQTGAPSLVLKLGEDAAGGAPGPLAFVIGAQVHRPFPTLDPAMRRKAKFQQLLALPPNAAPVATEHTSPGDALVAVYEGIFGTITSAQLQHAGVKTALDYVLTYVLGTQWSGTAARHAPPLTVAQMRSALMLRALFPEMPLEGADLLTELHAFLMQLPARSS